MNWKTLRNRYPEIWDVTYSSVLNELSFKDIPEYETKTKERIAHNVAFLVCDAIRKNKYKK